MSTQNKQVRSANECLITIDNTVIGIVSSIRISGDFALQDVSGIGDNVVIEYVPGVARVSVSVSGVLLIQKNLASVGIVPSKSVRDILNGNVFDVGVYSTSPGSMQPQNLLIKAISCSPSNIGYSFDTGQSAKYDHSFVALDLAGNLLG